MTQREGLSRGDIVLVLFPFTDLTAVKARPAVVVGRVRGDDVSLAFITSQVNNVDPNSDCLLEPSTPGFAASGLKAPSVIRLSKLVTLHRSLVRRKIGRVPVETAPALQNALRFVFEL